MKDFNPSRLIKTPMGGYAYKNYSICITDTAAVRVLSMCSHLTHTPLGAVEVRSMLRYFGFDLSMPVNKSVKQHADDPSMGDTVFYTQEKTGEKAEEKRNMKTEEKAQSWTKKIAPQYQMAVMLQARGNNMTPDNYVKKLEEQIDKEYSSDKPAVQEYFLMLIRRAS